MLYIMFCQISTVEYYEINYKIVWWDAQPDRTIKFYLNFLCWSWIFWNFKWIKPLSSLSSELHKKYWWIVYPAKTIILLFYIILFGFYLHDAFRIISYIIFFGLMGYLTFARIELVSILIGCFFCSFACCCWNCFDNVTDLFKRKKEDPKDNSEGQNNKVNQPRQVVQSREANQSQQLNQKTSKPIDIRFESSNKFRGLVISNFKICIGSQPKDEESKAEDSLDHEELNFDISPALNMDGNSKIKTISSLNKKYEDQKSEETSGQNIWLVWNKKYSIGKSTIKLKWCTTIIIHAEWVKNLAKFEIKCNQWNASLAEIATSEQINESDSFENKI